MNPESKVPVVFISYAHESGAFRQQVKDLADWLRKAGCDVLTDHPFADRPPSDGWQRWMVKSIEQAAVVLVVCTPKLKARYNGTAPEGSGRGETFEGAIVTQFIYDHMGKNDKFYPVLPDDGADADIPAALRPWSNGHRFPSGYDGILRLVRSTTPDVPVALCESVQKKGANPEGDASSSVPLPVTSRHEELVRALLESPEARAFLNALTADLLTSGVTVTTASDAVRHFSVGTREGGDAVLELFYAVRRALLASPRIEGVRRAAAALYCLAACRLVNRAAYEKQTQENGSRFVFHVPTDHNLICAVIATALFGGRLDLVDDAGLGLRGKYVFKVQAPISGDWSSDDFERALYAVLFPYDAELPDVTADTGPLPTNLRARLRARLASIRHVERQPFALVIRRVDPAVVRSVAQDHQVPVFLSISAEVASALLGMDLLDLQSEIQEFYRDYQAMAPEAKPPSTPAGAGSSQLTTTPGSVAFHVSGENVVVSTGGHSIAQAGTSHYAQQTHGASPAELVSLVQELVEAVDTLKSARARESVRSHVGVVQAEASKGTAANAGVVKGALEKIRSVGEAIDGGEKIVALCDKLLRMAGPFLAGLGS